jgi:hypothetical protein
MNVSRVVLGGLLGGVVFNAVSIAVNAGVLAGRYEVLGKKEALRVDPLFFFPAAYVPALFAVSIGLVWLYAAARPRLGPGPWTAIQVGAVAGLIGALPAFIANLAWTYTGGFVSMWWAIASVAGCALATLAGAWVYRE